MSAACRSVKPQDEDLVMLTRRLPRGAREGLRSSVRLAPSVDVESEEDERSGEDRPEAEEEQPGTEAVLVQTQRECRQRFALMRIEGLEIARSLGKEKGGEVAEHRVDRFDRGIHDVEE